MITPHLENLIHKGEAQFKTFVVACSGVSVLPVPKGCYIVITDIIYNPFTDVPENNSNGDTWANRNIINRKANKQIEFTSSKSKNHYVLRDSFVQQITPVIINTYLVHETNVTINICTFRTRTTANQLVFNYGTMPITNDVKQTPLGYGGLNDVVLEVELDNTQQQYLPAQPENDGIAANGDFRNQFKTDYDDDTKLIDSNNVAYNGFLKDRAYPIINIGYVLINKRPTETLQSS